MEKIKKKHTKKLKDRKSSKNKTLELIKKVYNKYPFRGDSEFSKFITG